MRFPKTLADFNSLIGGEIKPEDMPIDSIEAIEDLLNGREWHTMETAPKDREIIGGYINAESNYAYGPWTMRYNNGTWEPSWDGYSVVDYMSDFGTDYKALDMQPTHWTLSPSLPNV